MREYGKVSPNFWIGETGRKLRGDAHAQVVALYLMTSPHSNMLGVFPCPIVYVAHETGIPSEGASKALRRLIEIGFCTYDEASETVWVHEMARFQIAESLKPGDKRVAGVIADWQRIPQIEIRRGFWAKYRLAFHLPDLPPDPPKTSPLEAPSQGPCKPLGSQEQEQEQEQDIGEGASGIEGASDPAPVLTLVSDAPEPVALIRLPLIDGSEHPVFEPDVDEWRSAFPAVDVPGELKRMRVWLQANPTERKTPKGIRRFVVTWLGNQQDRPRQRQATPAGKAHEQHSAFAGAK